MIIRRGRFYSLKRRVPKRFARIEPREFVYKSLNTDSEAEARAKEEVVWKEMVSAWEAELEGNTAIAEKRFEAAKNLADRFGHRWLPVDQVAELPLEELLERIEASAPSGGQATRARGEALLGGVDKPEATTAKVLDMYWVQAADKTAGKTPDQLRRYKNPRIKSFDLFHKVVGVRSVASITRDDMLEFREYLLERINRGEITAGSANKDLLHFCGPIRFVNDMKGWDLNLPFQKLSFKEGPKKTRASFSTEWLRDKILYSGALGGLNEQARWVVEIMPNTGARPSEIAGTFVEHFELEGEIPLMHILPEERQIKNDHSLRAIPLVGISLKAAREAVEAAKRAGRRKVFPTYFGRDKISDTVNKFFRENGLKEKDETTLYSIRHNFEDRLLMADVADRVRSDLFGHSYQRQKYGTGGGDELRYKALLKIEI